MPHAPIAMAFEPGLGGFTARMPERVTLAAIEEWGLQFVAALAALPDGDRVCLLLDSNRHDFESIACARRLRTILEKTVVSERCERVAFVVPRSHREPHIASYKEAYFSAVREARLWLAGPQS